MRDPSVLKKLTKNEPLPPASFLFPFFLAPRGVWANLRKVSSHVFPAFRPAPGHGNGNGKAPSSFPAQPNPDPSSPARSPQEEPAKISFSGHRRAASVAGYRGDPPREGGAGEAVGPNVACTGVEEGDEEREAAGEGEGEGEGGGEGGGEGEGEGLDALQALPVRQHHCQ